MVLTCFLPPGDALFKAKSQRADVEDAEVVVESHDTEVERPLDLEEAEEVEEEKGEEFEKEGEADNKVLMHEWMFLGPVKYQLPVSTMVRGIVSEFAQ